MATAAQGRLTPTSPEDVAAALADAASRGLTVRPSGGQTKLGWGNVVPAPDLQLSLTALDQIVDHNEGDLTVIVQAGVPLTELQETVGRAGQMLAIDPPPDPAATIGGIVATSDGGPYRHRHHALRDLVIGVRAALPDGTVASAGGRVIKNVAGYDLGKLFTGSFGTLGVICEVSLRLHPRPRETATALGASDSPEALAAGAARIGGGPFEPLALDAAWEGRTGWIAARFGGATAQHQAQTARAALAESGLDGTVEEDDEPWWQRQRARQRSSKSTVLHIAAGPRDIAAILSAARDSSATAAVRAGLGPAWIGLPESSDDDAVAAISELRQRLDPLPVVVRDAPEAVRRSVDPWGPVDPGRLAIMRRVKERFDPQHTLNPGLFAGGI